MQAIYDNFTTVKFQTNGILAEVAAVYYNRQPLLRPTVLHFIMFNNEDVPDVLCNY